MDQHMNYFLESFTITGNNINNHIQKEKSGVLRCYYPNKCHLCHILDTPEHPLKKCSSCQLISYCETDHQRKDWKHHKDFCKVLTEVGGPKVFKNLKTMQDPPNASPDVKFKQICKRVREKKMILAMVFSKLKRKAFFFEMQIIMNPRICIVCFENDPSVLKSCPGCPQASFCVEHRNDPSHTEVCYKFKLACDLELAHPKTRTFFQIEVHTLKNVKFPFQKEGIRLPNSMKAFLMSDSCIEVKRSSKQKELVPTKIWEIYMTEAISLPLTLLYAMQKLDFKNQSSLVVHVAGATCSEIRFPIWELILHWLPGITNLSIVFVGPDLEKTEDILTVICKICQHKNVNFNLYSCQGFYQDYMERSNYMKPDIVVACNAGLHAYMTWVPAIQKVAQLHVPFVQTSFSELEAHQDIKFLQGCVPNIKYFSFGPNPFATYSCERNTDDEKVFTRNEILTIYDAA